MEKFQIVVNAALGLVGLGLVVTAEATTTRVIGGVLVAIAVVAVVAAVVQLRKKGRSPR